MTGLEVMAATPATPTLIQLLDHWTARAARTYGVDGISFEERQVIVERAKLAAHREILEALRQRVEYQDAVARAGAA